MRNSAYPRTNRLYDGLSADATSGSFGTCSAAPSAQTAEPLSTTGRTGDQVAAGVADAYDVRKYTVITVGLITLVVYLLVTTHGKNCHYNVHFAKRLVCTTEER